MSLIHLVTIGFDGTSAFAVGALKRQINKPRTAMLILTRKPGESLFIGDKIKVVVVEIKGNQIRLGIEAPSDVRILREEIYAQILEENKSAAAPVSGDSLDGLSAVLTHPAGRTTPVLRPVLSPARRPDAVHGGKKK